MKGPATELIHARPRRIVDVADPADDSRSTRRRRSCSTAPPMIGAYNEGRSTKYLYSRYTNPTVVGVGAKLAALDGAEAALLFSSGMAADGDDAAGHLRGRRRSRLQRGRSTAARCICCTTCWRGSASRRGSCRSRSSPHPDRVIGDRTRLVWFESPINPTLRCVDIASRRRRLPCARRPVGHRQHVCQPDQPAAAGARRRPGDAERHQVPERPQRRHRRRASRAGRAGRPIEQARRSCSARCMDPHAAYLARARPEDAAAAGGAAQRQRAGGRRIPGARIAACRGSTIRAWRRIPTTTSRGGR